MTYTESSSWSDLQGRAGPMTRRERPTVCSRTPRGGGLAVRLAVSAFSVVLGVVVPAVAVSIETVVVGNPGNPGEVSGESSYGGHGPNRVCGGVEYVYEIGKYEVTAGQYCEFLNAVAALDPYGAGLWNTDMSYGHDGGGCRIQRSGSPGSFTYSVAAEWEDRPANYLDWGDAARFCNWLHNGQPAKTLTGDPNEDADVTEDGSYHLNGATGAAALLAVTREPGATWVMPSEDEWYKAAYHKNDGASPNYFHYPTISDDIPSNDLIDPDPGNNATFLVFYEDYTTSYQRTEFGEHENSESPYGTFDQGGNVCEWTEAVLYDTHRGLRGGSAWYYHNEMLAGYRHSSAPTANSKPHGFRVARVPGWPEIVDALSRVFTVHNEAPSEIVDAVARQFTVYNNMLLIADIPDGVVDANVAYVGPEPDLVCGSLPVQWSLLEGPNEMAIDAGTGVVSWPSPGPAGSRHTITIRGENLEGTDDESWTLMVRGPHPADGEGDWVLGINEVVGYGAAWHRGEPWPTEPNTIPMDYVTRGGYLWKAGELYEFSATHDAPLCWQGVPVDGLTKMARLAKSAAKGSDVGSVAASRRIVLDLDAEGSMVQVAIDAVPVAAQVWAVEERPPPGCTPIEISEGGLWDPTRGVIRWGPFYDNEPRLLSYEAPATEELGPGNIFAGQASADGVSAEIAGETSVLPQEPLSFRCGPAMGLSGLVGYLMVSLVGLVILRRRLRR
jgi:formylglycine-generating enzyme